MRTNIVLNDRLVEEAFRYASVDSKRALIELALLEFVENHRRHSLQELRGKIKLKEDYDYKKLRNEE